MGRGFKVFLGLRAGVQGIRLTWTPKNPLLLFILHDFLF